MTVKRPVAGEDEAAGWKVTPGGQRSGALRRGITAGPGCPGSRPGAAWHTDAGTVGQDDLLLLADAQTPGGLLVAGGAARSVRDRELVRRRDSVLIVR